MGVVVRQTETDQEEQHFALRSEARNIRRGSRTKASGGGDEAHTKLSLWVHM